MEEIVKRKRVETLVSEAKAMLQQGDLQRCVELCDEVLGTTGVGRLGQEARKVKEMAEPILKSWERAANKAANRAKAKEASRHRMDVEEACRILNVTKDVELDQLEKAYKRESLRQHPDRNRNDPDATRKFQRLGAAYESLKTIAKVPYDPIPAIAAFKDALEKAEVHSSSSFADLQATLGQHPAFLAVRTQGERKQAYAEYRTQRQRVEADQKRKHDLKLISDFRALLDEFRAVDFETTSWESATLLLAREPRYKALPEHLRKDQFDEWRLKRKQEACRRQRERSSHDRRRRRRRDEDDSDSSSERSSSRHRRSHRSRRRRRDSY